MRLGVRLGLRDCMVALETLLDKIGHRPRVPLLTNYTKSWLTVCLVELRLQEGDGSI